MIDESLIKKFFARRENLARNKIIETENWIDRLYKYKNTYDCSGVISYGLKKDFDFVTLANKDYWGTKANFYVFDELGEEDKNIDITEQDFLNVLNEDD